jgi:hypothetical protein
MLIIAIVTQVFCSVLARAEELSFERYYIAKYPCEVNSIRDDDVHECQKHVASGGLYLFHGIGIVRRGSRVCGIAHFSSYQKTDVTRFVGTISGNIAKIQFSSSHDQEKLAIGTIVLTSKKAQWNPEIEEWSAGGGYHSSSFVAPRVSKPAERESYVVAAKRECEKFLTDESPFEKLGWDF